MIISRDSEGYINGYVLSVDMSNSPIVGVLTNLEEAPNFPEDQVEAWEHFKANYRAYTFHPVSPEYWRDNYGEGYEIPSEDIVSQFVFHPERSDVLLEEYKDIIRKRREVECFPAINRGTAWYGMLTAEQREELQIWYQSWLDAPETLIIPDALSWI